MAGSAKRQKRSGNGDPHNTAAKKISPYFNFCTLNREKLKHSNPNLPMNKALSNLWKTLSPEQKAAYAHPNADPLPDLPPSPQPQQDHEQQEEKTPSDKVRDDNADESESDEGSNLPLFPLTRVRRIMKADSDINKVSGEVVWAVASVAQSFVELLGEAALRVALEKKRSRTLRLEDIVTAISRQRRLADFLEDSITKSGKNGGGGGGGEEEEGEEEEETEKEPKPSKKSGKAVVAPPPGTRSITDFFASNNAVS